MPVLINFGDGKRMEKSPTFQLLNENLSSGSLSTASSPELLEKSLQQCSFNGIRDLFPPSHDTAFACWVGGD